MTVQAIFYIYNYEMFLLTHWYNIAYHGLLLASTPTGTNEPLYDTRRYWGEYTTMEVDRDEMIRIWF